MSRNRSSSRSRRSQDPQQEPVEWWDQILCTLSGNVFTQCVRQTDAGGCSFVDMGPTEIGDLVIVSDSRGEQDGEVTDINIGRALFPYQVLTLDGDTRWYPEVKIRKQSLSTTKACELRHQLRVNKKQASENDNDGQAVPVDALSTAMKKPPKVGDPPTRSSSSAAGSRKVRDVAMEDKSGSAASGPYRSSSTSAGSTANATTAPQRRLYSIKLVKGEQRMLGIDIASTDSRRNVIIEAIGKSGIIAMWNKENPQELVRVGDEILEINGTRGSVKEMVTASERSDNLEIVLMRPTSYNKQHQPYQRDRPGAAPLRKGPVQHWQVVCDKTRGGKLGACVNRIGDALLIEKLTDQDGLLQQWNTAHEDEPERCVLPGDRIIEINGVKGNAKNLIHQCHADQVLKMQMERDVQSSAESGKAAKPATVAQGQDSKKEGGVSTSVAAAAKQSASEQEPEKKPEASAAASQQAVAIAIAVPAEAPRAVIHPAKQDSEWEADFGEFVGGSPSTEASKAKAAGSPVSEADAASGSGASPNPAPATPANTPAASSPTGSPSASSPPAAAAAKADATTADLLSLSNEAPQPATTATQPAAAAAMKAAEAGTEATKKKEDESNSLADIGFADFSKATTPPAASASDEAAALTKLPATVEAPVTATAAPSAAPEKKTPEADAASKTAAATDLLGVFDQSSEKPAPPPAVTLPAPAATGNEKATAAEVTTVSTPREDAAEKKAAAPAEAAVSESAATESETASSATPVVPHESANTPAAPVEKPEAPVVPPVAALADAKATADASEKASEKKMLEEPAPETSSPNAAKGASTEDPFAELLSGKPSSSTEPYPENIK
eukprot:TRINITY_DN27600_c0_g1_i1.p1 TRINITY_DN27600_c0_g1~~TRINITY_DN27600_c0_g1_i1.p1  ORF type:complete len:843 (+),score=233.49 TRINITY_DN27600_c0_g1_i1:85-2613(+)